MRHSIGSQSAAFICICAVTALPPTVATPTAPAIPPILVTPTIEIGGHQ
jgi:hypothetical protein